MVLIMVLAHWPSVGYHSEIRVCMEEVLNCPPQEVYFYHLPFWLPFRYFEDTFHHNPIEGHYELIKKGLDISQGHYFISKHFAFLVFFPLALFYWYFLSCILIFVYQKISKWVHKKTLKKIVASKVFKLLNVNNDRMKLIKKIKSLNFKVKLGLIPVLILMIIWIIKLVIYFFNSNLSIHFLLTSSFISDIRNNFISFLPCHKYSDSLLNAFSCKLGMGLALIFYFIILFVIGWLIGHIIEMIKRINKNVYLPVWITISVIISIIINFNARSVSSFLISSLILGLIIFGILTLTIKLIQDVREKNTKKLLSHGIILVVVLIILYSVPFPLTRGVCDMAIQPDHFRTNIFTRQCGFGGGAHCLMGEPWYYKDGCNIPAEKKIEILKSKGVYNLAIEECNRSCLITNPDTYCSDRMGHFGKGLSCKDLVTCDLITCD